MTFLLYAYFVMCGLVVLALPPALYVIGCCAVDAFRYDPWLDGPRDVSPGHRPIPFRANELLDSPA